MMIMPGDLISANVPGAISAGLAARLMSVLLSLDPTEAVQSANAFPGCISPTGDFRQSCTEVLIESYQSTDPNVLDICKGVTYCTTMFSGLPPVQNTFYYPQDVWLDEVENANGTLKMGGQSLSRTWDEKQKTAQEDYCSPPRGSYIETCGVKARTYKSSDGNLASALLCVAELACETLEKSVSSSLVYFGILSNRHGGSVEKVENCDGVLITDPHNDHRCHKQSAEQIKELANERGSHSLRMT